MKQYCRYCGFCSEVDGGYYCGEHEKLISESQIKHANNCKDYGYTDAGDVISGGQYKPRVMDGAVSACTKIEQASLFAEAME